MAPDREPDATPDGASPGSGDPEGGKGRLTRVWEATHKLTVCTVKDALDDRAPGLAAEVAFYSILALPPLLLALIGLGAFIADVGPLSPGQVRGWVLDAAAQFLSPTTIRESIRPSIDGILEDGRPDVALLGFALALWAGSRATAVAIRAITIAYDLEARPGWLRRLMALGITLVGLVAGIVVLPVLVIGPRLGELLDVPGFAAFWKIAYWPAVGLAVAGLLASLYHVAVPWKTPWSRDVPGAMLAVTIWLGGSAALRAYAAWSIRGDTTYGALATPIVLLLWLYVTALAVMMGAELNAEIEKLWPRRADSLDDLVAEADADGEPVVQA